MFTITILFMLAWLACLTAKGVYIMATLQDLQTDVQSVEDGVAELAREIADLKASGPTIVTQEQLDALDQKAKDILAAIQAAK